MKMFAVAVAGHHKSFASNCRLRDLTHSLGGNQAHGHKIFFCFILSQLVTTKTLKKQWDT